MKLIKTFIGVFALLFICGNAMAQKIGHINSAELLPMMTEYKAAETSMETYQKQKKTQLENKYSTYQTQMQTFIDQRQKGSLSPMDEQTKAAEIQGMETELATLEQQIQIDIAKKQEELLVPIQNRAIQAIQDVASEQGYTYVIDSSAGQLLVFPDSDNLLPAVKTKLGIL